MSVNEQLKVVDSLCNKQPHDDYERTYLHYLSKVYGMPFAFKVLLNITSALIIPILLAKYYINSKDCFFVSKKNALLLNAANKYGIRYDYSNIFPFSIVAERFDEIYVNEAVKYPELWRGVIDKTVLDFWFSFVTKHPLNFHLHMSCLIALGNLNRILIQYKPQCIFAFRVESNFTSSLVTSFCELNNVTYELFMHGELLRNKNIAFVRFSKIYIWDMYYKNLFTRVYAWANEFIPYKPRIFDFHETNRETVSYATYYLQGSLDGGYVENLDKIIEVLSMLVVKGKIVRVRPHPRWSNLEEVNNICKKHGIIVENFREVSIEKSLMSTENAISVFSTVLLQALFSDFTAVIIDNISNPYMYEQLVQADYIILKKNHLLLSDFIKLSI